MTYDRHPGRLLRGSVLTIAVSLLVAACSGATASVAPSVASVAPAPTTAPTPSPTPEPTPSPTPADVSAAFFKIMSDKEFSGDATLTGTLAIGATTGAITGTYAGDSDSSNSSMTFTAGTFSQTSDKIGTGGKRWTRVSPGPWLEDLPKAGSSKSLADALRDLGSVTDLGVESHLGKQLHHLRPTAGGSLTGEQVGLDLGNATDAEFAMDFYATDDGTPAAMVLTGTWTQGTGSSAVKYTVEIEYAFISTGQPHTVEPPNDVWVRYTSKANGYTMAYPPDWTVKGAKGKDTYLLNGQPYVYVGTSTFRGTTAAFVTALKKTYKKEFGDPTSETPTRLGGEPAVRLLYEFTNAAKQDVTLVNDVISREATGWEVFLATQGGREDIAVFDQFVATFAFTQ